MNLKTNKSFFQLPCKERMYWYMHTLIYVPSVKYTGIYSSVLSRYEPYPHSIVLLHYMPLDSFIHSYATPVLLNFQTEAFSKICPIEFYFFFFFFLPFVARCQNYTNTAGLIPLCRWVSWYFVILILLPGSCNVCWCNCQNRKGLVSVICVMHIRQQRVASTNMANCLWET